MLQADEGQLQRWIAPHNGFFIGYGYTYRPSGAGIAFGGGYRHDLFDRRARVVFEAGESFRNYHMVRADFSLPRLARQRLELGLEGVYRHQPQDDFYGPGPDSNAEDRVNYLYKDQDVQGRAVVKVRPWMVAGTRFGRLKPSIRSGTDDSLSLARTGLRRQRRAGFERAARLPVRRGLRRDRLSRRAGPHAFRRPLRALRAQVRRPRPRSIRLHVRRSACCGSTCRSSTRSGCSPFSWRRSAPTPPTATRCPSTCSRRSAADNRCAASTTTASATRTRCGSTRSIGGRRSRRSTWRCSPTAARWRRGSRTSTSPTSSTPTASGSA